MIDLGHLFYMQWLKIWMLGGFKTLSCPIDRPFCYSLCEMQKRRYNSHHLSPNLSERKVFWALTIKKKESLLANPVQRNVDRNMLLTILFICS